MNNTLSCDENSRASINQDTRYVKDTYQKRPENEYVVKEMRSAFPLPGRDQGFVHSPSSKNSGRCSRHVKDDKTLLQGPRNLKRERDDF